LQDEQNKNVIAREIHATLAAMPYSPLGFLEVVFMSLTDTARLKHYWNLII
jgi:hypothetical protein